MFRVQTPIFVLLLAFVSGPRASHAFDLLPENFFVVLGGMRPGSGLAAGVEYQNGHFANGVFDVRLSSRFSIRRYQAHEVEITKPHVIDPRIFVRVLGSYRSHTQVDYFGIGPDTAESSHANYGLDGAAVFGDLGLYPSPKVTFGGRLGFLGNRIRPGRDDALPSAEELFDDEALRGLVEQPDYYLLGVFTAIDTRDDLDDPTSGVFYNVQASRYRGLDLEGFDFQELDLDARHFFPIDRFVTFAFRARGVFTWTESGDEVPFFLLPSLGGTENLIAFENDRFRDRNVFFLSHELRVHWTPEIRLEAFFDVGQVFPNPSALEFSRLEVSSGFGARYKLGRRVLMGASLGFGREGSRISLVGDFRF